METETAGPPANASKRPVVRCGRPPREFAGEVEARILDAAGRVFLERGFGGASVDEIADVARAGKPTIYARFAGKEALFVAAVERRVLWETSREAICFSGATFEERLETIAADILRRILAPETVGLMRMVMAEAHRFPDLAVRVSSLGRERQTDVVVELLTEIASEQKKALPAFAPERLPETARRFLDLVVAPNLLRAMFGYSLETLQAEIEDRARVSVSFFLAACGIPAAAHS